MIHISELVTDGLEWLRNIPKHPYVEMSDEGVPFLVLADGREYKIENDPAATLRLINHLSQKDWVNADFIELATLRICMAMGWWYPEDNRSEIEDELALPYTLSKSQIIKRGWTRPMIEEFLGEPEWKQPHYMYPTDIHLYDYDDVIAAECTDEWQKKFMEKLPKRVARSGKTLNSLLLTWTEEQKRQKRKRSYFIRRESVDA